MSRYRVLVVDDNAANLKLVNFVLANKGFDVIAVESAAAALQSLASVRPHVILLDLQMPGMDGFTLAQHLKADPAMAAIPIVAVTAYAMKGDEARARAAGCDGYVSKPIDTRTLPDVVRQFAERSGAASE